MYFHKKGVFKAQDAFQTPSHMSNTESVTSPNLQTPASGHPLGLPAGLGSSEHNQGVGGRPHQQRGSTWEVVQLHSRKPNDFLVLLALSRMPVPRATLSISVSETAPTYRPPFSTSDGFGGTFVQAAPDSTLAAPVPTPVPSSSHTAGYFPHLQVRRVAGSERETERHRWAPRQQGACSQSPPRPPCAGDRRLAPPTGPCPAHRPPAFCGFWRKSKKSQGQSLVLSSLVPS